MPKAVQRPLSERTTIDLSKGGRTKQSDLERSDINRIMAKHIHGEPFTHVAKGMPRYEDVTFVSDFHSAQNLIAQAEQLFMELPSSIRDRRGIDNDAGKFIAFVEDPENAELLEELGLVDPEESSLAEEIAEAIIVPTTATEEELAALADAQALIDAQDQ